MSSLALINEFLGQPPNASEHGFQIDHILEFCHWFMAALFVGWSVYFAYVLIRFRKGRHPAADHEGVKSGISTHLEFSVVLIEAVLLIGFAIPLWAKRVNQFPDTQDAILAHVVGQQFNWNFHLPGPDGQFGRRDISLVSNTNPMGLDPNDPVGKDDIVAVGELHVPVNRPVILELSSKDVIHNFALPHMRIAQDAIPGSIIPMWFKPIKTGTFEVICGQLCGLGHYSMKGSVVVDSAEDYQAWLKERAEMAGTQAAPAAADRPPGEPSSGATPGTIAPPGAPKTENPGAKLPTSPAPSPAPGG
ncbi:MAG: cytochrome c oxidase subunit [Verrucomicrobiota bacterium]|jgi:cytochrome c oxidase subunit 2